MAHDDNVIPFPGGRRVDDHQTPADVLAETLIEQAGGVPDAFSALMSRPGGLELSEDPFARRRPTKLPRLETRVGFVVRVDLDGSEPQIWRRLQLVSDLSLAQFHDVLQVAMGWTDSHLHHFIAGPKNRDWATEPFLNPYDVSEGEDGIPETDVRLDEVLASKGDRLFYDYDFGDNWEHTIKLERIQPWIDGDPSAQCLDGRRACPPEDVGGLPGYAEVLDAVAGRFDPSEAEWMSERLEWLPDGFDPAAFSPAETNELLTSAPLPSLEGWHPAIQDLLVRAGGSAMSETAKLIKRAISGSADLSPAEFESATIRYRRLLSVIGDGVKLTAAGYLPPRLVDTLYADLDMDAEPWGKGNREELTYPVLSLRESATALGLLRKNRGYLLPTKAGQRLLNDPRGLLRYIAAKLPLGREHERDAGLIALLFAAAEEPLHAAHVEAAEIMTRVGWQLRDGAGMEFAVVRFASPTTSVLEHLAGGANTTGPQGAIARALLRGP